MNHYLTFLRSHTVSVYVSSPTRFYRPVPDYPLECTYIQLRISTCSVLTTLDLRASNNMQIGLSACLTFLGLAMELWYCSRKRLELETPRTFCSWLIIPECEWQTLCQQIHLSSVGGSSVAWLTDTDTDSIQVG